MGRPRLVDEFFKGSVFTGKMGNELRKYLNYLEKEIVRMKKRQEGWESLVEEKPVKELLFTHEMTSEAEPVPDFAEDEDEIFVRPVKVGTMILKDY